MNTHVLEIYFLACLGFCLSGCQDEQPLRSQECSVVQSIATGLYDQGYGCKPQEQCVVFDGPNNAALCVNDCCRNDGSIRCFDDTQCAFWRTSIRPVYYCIPNTIIQSNSASEFEYPIDKSEQKWTDYVESCKMDADKWKQLP